MAKKEDVVGGGMAKMADVTIERAVQVVADTIYEVYQQSRTTRMTHESDIRSQVREFLIAPEIEQLVEDALRDNRLVDYGLPREQIEGTFVVLGVLPVEDIPEDREQRDRVVRAFRLWDQDVRHSAEDVINLYAIDRASAEAGISRLRALLEKYVPTMRPQADFGGDSR